MVDFYQFVMSARARYVASGLVAKDGDGFRKGGESRRVSMIRQALRKENEVVRCYYFLQIHTVEVAKFFFCLVKFRGVEKDKATPQPGINENSNPSIG